jgi:hypothetical protein
MELPVRCRPAPLSLAAIGLAIVLAACSDSAGPPAVGSVTVSAVAATIAAGDSVQLTAVVRDAAGNVLTDRPVTWSSSNTVVGSVHETSGRFRAHDQGSVTITARAETKTGTISLTVVPPPVALVVVQGDTLLEVGQARQYAAVLSDAAGNVLTGRSVTWTSSDTLVARVSATGLVLAVGAGPATLAASSETKTGTLLLTVAPSSGNAPAITSITPATLSPGATAVITGTGFGELAAANTVTFGDAAGIITGASATSLTVRVPCTGSGDIPVVVTSNGLRGAAVNHPMVVNALELGVGEARVLGTTEASRCNELPAGTGVRYLVAVFNAGTAVISTTDFQLSGNITAAAGPAPPFIAPQRTHAVQPVRDAQAIRDSIHTAWLEQERALYQQLRTLADAGAFDAEVIAAQQRPVPTVGELRTLYWNRNGCSDSTQTFQARAVYVGERGVVWEDSDNTLLAGADAQLAGYYTRLGTIFDQEQYATVRDNFGDPLRRDLDQDGRVHMVFTQRLNGTGAAAYVTSCDQFPRPGAAASNYGEYFYGFVPTIAGSNLNSSSYPDGWFNFMARTVVHEVKHIASHAARIANGAPAYEQSWLEEGTARHAEELWVRAHLHSAAWKANTGYGSAATNGIYCDFVPADPACMAADALRRPSMGMRRHFNEILPKLVEPWDYSPFGQATGQTGSVFYQTSWSLVRFVIDRWGTSDAAFLAALNSSLTNGVTNLTAVAGAPLVDMIGLWGLALYADDFPGLVNPSADLQFPTWNLRDIYDALHREPSWAHRFSAPFMLQPVQLPFGAFTAQRTGLRSGAHAYFELAGTMTTPQLLRLQALGGEPAPAGLHIAVARLQ